MPRPPTSAHELACATVFRELLSEIVAHASLKTVAYVLLRVNVAFRDAALVRLAFVRPLLQHPFSLDPVELICVGECILAKEDRAIKDSGVAVLATALANGALVQLGVLYLHSNQIGDDGLAALVDSCAKGALAQLKLLGLANNRIGDAGLSALANASAKGGLAKLEGLFLDGNAIGDQGLTSLAGACANGGLAQLEVLSLPYNQIGDQGLTALSNACAEGPALVQLKELCLGGSRGRPAGPHHQDNPIGARGLTRLWSALASGAMANLETVLIDGGMWPISPGPQTIAMTSFVRQRRGVVWPPTA